MEPDWTNTVSMPMFVASDEKIVTPLIAPLFEDAVEYDRLLSENDNQFARRGYLRAGFALIEGQLYFLKEFLRERVLDDFHATGSLNITAAILLDDTAYSIGESGRLQKSPSRPSFQNFCAFVLRTACSLGSQGTQKLTLE